MSREAERSSKGQRTRQRIVERAAVLFNTRGVAGTSMADVSEATGLEKGGVYNHFASKEELAVAAFEHAANLVLARIDAAIASEETAAGKIRAVLDLYRERSAPFFVGGCPVMNTAIEADDTNPDMRRRARVAFDRWRRTFCAILDAGMAAGEFCSIDSRATATVFLSTIEGAVMFSTLYGSRGPLRAAVEHLDGFLDSLLLESPARES